MPSTSGKLTSITKIKLFKQLKWFMQYSPATRTTNITLATEGILAIQSSNPCPFRLGFQRNSL